MKIKSQPRFRLLRDDPIFSFPEMLKVMSVVVLVTFIIGIVFGLKMSGDGDNRRTVEQAIEEVAQPNDYGLPSFEERTKSTPEKEAAWNRAMAERRAQAARDSYYNSTNSTRRPAGGSHSFDAYRPAAEDVGRHWEQETGRPMSDSDVRTIQGIMKAIDDK